MLDKRYQNTAMGRDVVDFLAWLGWAAQPERTLDPSANVTSPAPA
jgi:hypothetical protein